MNYYDAVKDRIVRPSLMLKAHLSCLNEVEGLPRKLVKKDKHIKFDKTYDNMFKKNFQVFNYNL